MTTKEQVHDQLSNAVGKLSLMQIRVGELLDKLEIEPGTDRATIETYAKELGVEAETLRRCRTMYRMAKTIKANLMEVGATKRLTKANTDGIDPYSHLTQLVHQKN
jgi:hypothetical protein